LSASAALAIRGLTKEYLPGKPVLRGVSLDIGSGGLTAIIGASGTGKSTLIRCINRLVEPTSGSIVFEGALAHAVPRVDRVPRGPNAGFGSIVGDQ